jgi:predicted MFS family arabinose efflux permease
MWLGDSTVTYIVLLAAFFAIFAFMTILGIICWSYIGEKSPEHMVGKVMSLSMALMAAGTAAGNYVYGLLFDHFADAPHVALFIVGGASLLVAMWAVVEK